MSHNYIYGSFSRLSDFPLDDRYLFETREKLNSYLTVSGRMTTTAYEGQLVYIIDEEALCLVQKDEQGGFYPQTITSEAYDDADIRNEIDQIKDIIANGKYNVTETDGGVAYGIGTIARHHQFAVGEYNKEDPNAIFSVGNGEPANRNNALTVNRDGTVTLSSDPKKDNDAVTKKYVDDAVSNVTVDLSGYATSEDLKQATENLIDDTKLNESIKDFVTKEEVPSLVDTSNLVTEDELKAAIDGISGSEVTAEEFNNLSEKVNTIDDDIDGIIEDIKKQSENILSLDDRIIELENNPAVPEDVVDEDRLSEVLSFYATKNDIASILTKKLVDSVDIENNKIHIGDSESDPVENVIYLVKNIDAALPDIYNEYLVLDGALTLIGDTSTDLNDYYDKNDIDSIINNKANKVHKHTLSDISDYIAPEVPTKVSELENDSKFITEDDIDLSNYYTKEEVDDLINNSGDVTIPITPIVLDDSVTENSSNGVKSSGIYAFVKDEISKIEHPEQNTPNLEGYATEKYVQDEIAKIEIPEVPSLDGYATKEYVSNEINNLDIPNLEGYATQEWVEEQSFLKELPSHTHDQYLTENDIHDSVEKLNKLKDDFDSHMEVVGNFFGESDVATKHDQLVEIKKAIDDLHDQVIDGNIAGALVDRVLEIEKTHYTKTEVNDLLEEKSNVDHTHDEYTTEDDVNDLIDSKLGQISIDSVDPSKVIFPEEIKTTYSIGNVTVSNNTPTTLISAGQSLKDFFNIFVDETSGSNTNPSLSNITATGSGNYYEVGTTLSNPTVSFVFNDGAYKYGPEPTGCEVTSISAIFNGTVKTLDDFTKSGNKYTATYPDAIVTEGSCCQLTDLDVSYSAGVAPNTNLGNTIADNNIKAGTINNKTASTCIGYRPVYAGTFTSKTEINSIENLFTDNHKKTGSTAHNIKNHTEFSISIPVGTLRVAFAYPAHWNTGLPKVLDTNDANTNIMTANTQKITVKHGLAGYDVDYNIVYFDAANPTTAANTYKITI